MDLKEIRDPGHWHIAMVIAGVAITVAAVAASAKPIVLVGLGLALFGFGEMKNHPYFEELDRDGLGNVRGKLHGNPRKPSALGYALDGVGVAIFIAGLIWFVCA